MLSIALLDIAFSREQSCEVCSRKESTETDERRRSCSCRFVVEEQNTRCRDSRKTSVGPGVTGVASR